MRRGLDTYCKAGGATRGYQLAGFHMTGVDIEPQPNYCGEAFIQADALEMLADPEFLAGFDFIHASPPCQAFSSMRVMHNARPHPDLLTPTRELLKAWGGPYVIENVPGSPIDVRPPDLFGYPGAIMLCGTMFDLRNATQELRRHRWFEGSTPLVQMPCRHTSREVIGFYGDHARRRRRRVPGLPHGGQDILGAEKMRLLDELMGIDWMAWTEANQAIPPAYTDYIGRQILAALEAAA